jgi:2-methylaconitate cis-trans-isomerase PrpF
MRGGTSKGIVFHERDLPQDMAARNALFLAAMGSPDPYGRQLDGMGGGVSSLSKVCIVGPPSRPDADVDFTFAQIEIDRPEVDYAATCGNMSSTIGPFAVDEGLVPPPADGEAAIRVHNTNTKKIYIARFPVKGGHSAVDGDLAIDGVAGTGAPVRLDYADPGGAKTGKLLPTGKAADMLEVEGLGRVPVSMIDAANPCVFVPAEAIGATATELPTAIEQNAQLLARLEAIRRAASVAMGIAPDLEKAGSVSVPFVAFVAPPVAMSVLSGRKLAPADMDIAVRMMSNGQAHRATPLTGALCLAVATRIRGSIPNEMARRLAEGASQIRIAHASGVIVVDAKIGQAKGGSQPHAEYAAVYRTARRLFDGRVHYRAEG